MCQPLTAEGEFALVREHLEIALLQPSVGWIAFGDHELYNLLADVAALQRDQAAIQKYAPLAEELASRYDHKLYQAIAYRALGVLYRLTGQHAKSQRRLGLALEIFQQIGTHWQVGRTFYELGELSALRQEISRSRDYFTRAMEAFDSMQAIKDAARVRVALERRIE